MGVSIDVGLNEFNAFPQNCQMNLRHGAHLIWVVWSQSTLSNSWRHRSSRCCAPRLKSRDSVSCQPKGVQPDVARNAIVLDRAQRTKAVVQFQAIREFEVQADRKPLQGMRNVEAKGVAVGWMKCLRFIELSSLPVIPNQVTFRLVGYS